jgi:hypothetical protein
MHPRIATRVWIRAAAIASLALAQAAFAHGTEREYGTPINGQHEERTEIAPSPSFALLTLDVSATKISRALDSGALSEAEQEAARLAPLSNSLVHECRALAQDAREAVAEGAAKISQVAGQLEDAIRERDLSASQAAVGRVQEVVGQLRGVVDRAGS